MISDTLDTAVLHDLGRCVVCGTAAGCPDALAVPIRACSLWGRLLLLLCTLPLVLREQ